MKDLRHALILKFGPSFMPTEIPIHDQYRLLSQFLDGDIIAIVNLKDFRKYRLFNFRITGLFLPRFVRFSPLKIIPYAVFSVLWSILRHHFKQKYDVIIAHDPLVTGALGLLMAKLTGAKLILEVNGNFTKSFESNSQKQSLLSKMKSAYARTMLPFVLKQSNAVKLLYHSQLQGIVEPEQLQKIFLFHDFVPINRFKPQESSKSYILFIGYPWYLKGVDLLINAFKSICDQFPDYRLLIVGFCPDKSPLIELIDGNDRIILKDPVWYDDVIQLIQDCSIFVLPSRTEAMGRVLLEAMAAKKPIIASNVDGIPTYIKHGYNGLLFESENVDDLAIKIKDVLNNSEYATTLAENAYAYVNLELSEEKYVEAYRDFVERVVNG